MKYDRRKFLQLSGSIAAGLAIAPSACKLMPKKDSPVNNDTVPVDDAKTLEAFGLQLYTLRQDFPKDPKGVLKQVADMGYKQVESFEGPKGMFWGMTNTEFKSYLDGLGMTIVASHCNLGQNAEKKIEEAAAIGMKYLITPWVGPQKTLDDFKKLAENFNRYGEMCNKAGLRFAYHNHDYSFKPIDGQMPQDVMMQNTDAALVDYEMDIYWVVTGGQDPIAWIKKYPNRFTLCHIKDRAKNPGTDNGKNSCDLGTGSIDFSKVLKAGMDNGMKYFIVEQEFYPNGTPLEAVKTDAEYMKKLKI